MGKEHDSEILKRYSFTLPPNLIEQVDSFVDELNINRSMVVREALTHWVDHKTKEILLEGEGVATISYLYDHHDSRVINELMQTQHSFDQTITTTSHIHLSHDTCYEITVCKDDFITIRTLVDNIRKIKGIHSLNISYARE